MLQNKFEMPLDLAIKSSKFFQIYLVVIFLFALTSISISTALPVSLRMLLVIAIVVMAGFIYTTKKYQNVTHLKIDSSGEWHLEVNGKKYADVKLSGECIVTYFLIWLNFSVDNLKGKKEVFHVLLLPDSSDKDLLRQLRVRLRFQLYGNNEMLNSEK